MATINLRQSYYHGYRKNEPNPNVDVKLYLSIVLGFIKYMMSLIFKGRMVRLPSRMGIMGVIGTKRTGRIEVDENGREIIKGLRPNWPATKEFWKNNPEAKAQKKLVFYFNEHTNGYLYKLRWIKKNMIVKNKNYYELVLSRRNKQTLGHLIMDGEEFLTDN